MILFRVQNTVLPKAEPIPSVQKRWCGEDILYSLLYGMVAPISFLFLLYLNAEL